MSRGHSISDTVIHEGKNWGLILIGVFLLFAFAGPILKSCGGSVTTGAAGTGAVVGAAGGAAACKTFCNRGGGGGAGGGGGNARGQKDDTTATTEAPSPTTPPAPTPPSPEDEEDEPESRIRPERGFFLPEPDRSASLRPPRTDQWQPVPMPGFLTQ